MTLLGEALVGAAGLAIRGGAYAFDQAERLEHARDAASAARATFYRRARERLRQLDRELQASVYGEEGQGVP